MKYKLYALLLATVAPCAFLAAVYIFGWLLTLILMAFGMPLSSARIVGIALSFLLSFLFISFIAQQK